MIKYSPTETRLLDLLRQPRNRRGIDIAGLVKQFFTIRNRVAPYHAAIQIATALRSLDHKIKLNKETFRIEREGKYPIIFRYKTK